VRLEISQRGPVFDGHEFGASGAYEKITGRLHGALDPDHVLNSEIVNLERAPRNAQGLVDYAVDICILKPADPARGNGRILFDTLNRGDKLALIDINGSVRGGGSNDPQAAADAGNGFLMRCGYTVLFAAWQGGLSRDEGHMVADFPVATDDGEPLVGLSREEIVFGHADSPARAPLNYPAAAPDPSNTSLSVRQHEHDTRIPLPSECWRFVGPRTIEIDRPLGFGSGALYELIYPACDPIVMGMGFAAVRDAVSFFRYATADEAGRANPLAAAGQAPEVAQVIAYGRSQPGRFLREFVRTGFNEDLSGHRVFDGIFTAIAGSRRIFLNHEFAQPGRFHRQHEDHLYPADQFPFTYETLTDSFTGETDGILQRARARGVCPRIIHIDSSTEFWQGRSSLLVADEKGEAVPIPEEVRLYLYAGTMHAGPAMLAHPGIYSQDPVYELNDVDYNPLNRALIVALDEWVSGVAEPPDSRYPNLPEGTLAAPFPPEASGFPAIPGVRYPRWLNTLAVTTQETQPPQVFCAQAYPVLVPALDADGNEIAGIRLPEIAVPVATYTGWNLRKAEFAEDALMLVGAQFPFAATAAAREALGDPRLSLAERYPSRADYVAAVRAAALALVSERLMLEEDVEQAVRVAEARPWPAS
jgi:hypothetical protein